MNIPSRIVCVLREREKKRMKGELIGTVLFYVVMGVFCYFAAARERSEFSPTTAPIVFWSVVLVLVLIPLVRYRLWRYCAPRVRRATVVRIRNHMTRIERTDRNVGRVDRPSDMQAVDSCTILLQADKGRPLSVTVARPERAALAREYYREGDRVCLLRAAAVPFNETRLPPHPLCLACGNVAKDHETDCPLCGAPLLGERAEKNVALDGEETL